MVVSNASDSIIVVSLDISDCGAVEELIDKATMICSSVESSLSDPTPLLVIAARCGAMTADVPHNVERLLTKADCLCLVQDADNDRAAERVSGYFRRITTSAYMGIDEADIRLVLGGRVFMLEGTVYGGAGHLLTWAKECGLSEPIADCGRCLVSIEAGGSITISEIDNITTEIDMLTMGKAKYGVALTESKEDVDVIMMIPLDPLFRKV